MIYFVDLDFTITDPTHRLAKMPTENLDKVESWIEYNKACGGDSPIYDVIRVINALSDNGHLIYILTGRSSHAYIETVEWLIANDVCFDKIFMRGRNDSRKDYHIKLEVIKSFDKDEVVGVFEDNPEVIKVLRENGYRVFDVGNHKDMTRADIANHGHD